MAYELLSELEMNKKRIAAERARVNAMGTLASQDVQQEGAEIESNLSSYQQPPLAPTYPPVTEPLVTPEQQVFQANAITKARQATMPKVPLPQPQPTINALTTNAQMDEMVRTATGRSRIEPTTGKPMLEPLTEYRLGLQAKEGGKRGLEAQQRLQEAGVTAPTNILANQPSSITNLKAQFIDTSTLPSAQRKVAEQDRARARAIFSQQREQAYQDDVRKMAYDTAQAKLGNERLRTTEIQGQIDLHAETLLDKQIERQLKIAQAPYDISKAKTQAERDYLQLENEKAIQALINPDTVKADELVAAPSVEKYKQTWDEGMRLSVRYNIPAPVRNQLHLGVLASSYDSPVELAKDVEGMKDFPEDVIGVRGGDVAKYIPDIREALYNNLPPDQAVEQILKDSGKDPTDKGYPQLALNISAGVWKEYKDAGNAALAEAQAQKHASDARHLQTASAQLTQQLPLLGTAEGFNGIVVSTQKQLNRLSAFESGKHGALATQRIRSTLGLGAPEQYYDTTPSRIRTMIINHLAETAGDNPNYKAWLEDQSDNPNSPLSNLLTMGVAKAQEGMKEKRIEQLKIIDANEKKNLFTEFDDKGNAVTFGTAEEAEQYRRAPSWGKEAIAENAKARIRYRLGNEANRTQLENRLDKITARVAADRANLYLTPEEKEIREAINQPIINEIKAELDRLDRIDVKLMTPPPPEDNELPVMTPEEVRNAPIGTKFRTTDGRIGTRQ